MIHIIEDIYKFKYVTFRRKAAFDWYQSIPGGLISGYITGSKINDDYTKILEKNYLKLKKEII